MPRAKKKVEGNSLSAPSERPVKDSIESLDQTQDAIDSPTQPNNSSSGQRKRGWRDIEAISERARLKKMLVDIWHEDIELDEDIFGDSDHLSGFYANIEEEIEIDEDLVDDLEDFDEKEE